MIFVSVGTQKFPFNRLLALLDELVAGGHIEDKVFAQIGLSYYKPQHYEYVDYLKTEEFDAYMQQCELVITHSGVATIVAALKQEKPVIVVPRLAKYGEHVDDHQVEIADTFSEQNYILKYQDGEDLSAMIAQARSFPFARYVSKRETVVQMLRDYIGEVFA